MRNSQPAAACGEPLRLSYKEARVSPCTSCGTAPCCTYLPLHTFKVASVRDVDYAGYLLNFDRIELGLSAEGDWSVYYRYPCRFLSRDDFRCTVHGTPDQPNICVNYNPYNCWYKRALHRGADDFVRVDLARLEHVADRLVFDGDGAVVGGPSWAEIQAGFVDLPISPLHQFPEGPEDDPVAAEWARLVERGEAGDAEPATYGHDAPTLIDPCLGCAAHCCRVLLFPQEAPATRSALDFMRFSLGFPGVEIGVSDEGWALVVRTTCRHLRDNRCSVFGQPERPLLCRYYDAWKCQYKPQFGQPRPAGFLRLRLEHLDYLGECMAFDEQGRTVQLPPMAEIRQHVEARLRAARAEAAAR